jgi:hypothetical protein
MASMRLTWPSDLDAPILEVLRRFRDSPLGFSDRPGLAEEIGHLPGVDARLAFVACMQQLLAAAAELPLEASDEIEGVGREHFARPSHHRALDLYLLNSGQPSANVHEARPTARPLRLACAPSGRRPPVSP